MARSEMLTRNFYHLDHLIDDNAMCIHEPFTWARENYISNVDLADVRTDMLAKALVEALDLPDNISFNDVLAMCQ